jgi:phasin family protein
MADSQSKIEAAAEKAFAAAAEKKAGAAVSTTAVAAALAAEGPGPDVSVPAKLAVNGKSAGKKVKAVKAAPAAVAAHKPTKPVAAKVRPAREKLPVPISPVTTIEPTPTITQLKDKIMETATNKTAEFTAKVQDGVAEMQSRAKAAYDKGAELTADVTAFHKGNFDALVESGKVLAAGMQDLGRTAVEEARAAADTMTADFKAIAAVKSPTELFQLQGEIARRNLDTLVARTSKNAELMMKLANDAFAPLSSRASVAMERLTKAA